MISVLVVVGVAKPFPVLFQCWMATPTTNSLWAEIVVLKLLKVGKGDAYSITNILL